jgi:2-hydroxychromene-2-carboxylate isomerase
MRLLLAAGERRRDLSHALYRAYWIEGRDVADRDVLREVAGDELVSRLDEPEVKEGLRAASDEALAMGVFGVPTFLVDDQLFWGQDRLAFVEKALSGWRVAA